MIRSLHRDREMTETALVPSPNIDLRNIVAAIQNPLLNAREIDIHVLGSDVNEYDLKTEASRSAHRFEGISARKRGLDREALSHREVFIGETQHLFTGSNSRSGRCSERMRQPVWIQQRSKRKGLEVAA